MKTFFLILSATMLMLLPLRGQEMAFGLNGGLLLHFLSETQWQGTGSQAGCWARKPLTETGSLQLSLGFRQLGGINRLSLSTEDRPGDEETLRQLSAIQLTALKYLDAEVGWVYQHRPESAWSIYLGAYYARLLQWQDFDRGLTLVNGGASTTTDPNYNLRQELSGSDFGLCLGAFLRLAEGLQAWLQIRRGIPDLIPGALFPDTPKDHYTAFSMGLSARLF